MSGFLEVVSRAVSSAYKHIVVRWSVGGGMSLI